MPYIHALHIILAIDCSYFPIDQSPIFPHDGDALCSLRGTNCTFNYCLNELEPSVSMGQAVSHRAHSGGLG